ARAPGSEEARCACAVSQISVPAAPVRRPHDHRGRHASRRSQRRSGGAAMNSTSESTVAEANGIAPAGSEPHTRVRPEVRALRLNVLLLIGILAAAVFS